MGGGGGSASPVPLLDPQLYCDSDVFVCTVKFIMVDFLLLELSDRSTNLMNSEVLWLTWSTELHSWDEFEEIHHWNCFMAC